MAKGIISNSIRIFCNNINKIIDTDNCVSKSDIPISYRELQELSTVNGIFSARMIGQHLMLKSVSLGVTTPFFSASLIETVQSDIACEKPGVFDIFKVSKNS